MRTLLMIALSALGTTACWLTPAQQREETLVREARAMNDDLRWERYEQVSKSMPPEDGRLFLHRANAVAEELVMGDSDVESITFGVPSTTAVVVAKLSWYYKRDGVVKSTTVEQRWKQEGGLWVLVKQRRLRGERFPLVTEPVAPAPEP